MVIMTVLMEIRPTQGASVTNLRANAERGAWENTCSQSYRKMQPIVSSSMSMASTGEGCGWGKDRESVLNF